MTEQINAEIDREWDGEGLPPVGTWCEFKPDPSEDRWIKCVFLAHVGGEYFVDIPEGQSYSRGVDRMLDRAQGRFRPIKSEEDKAIDEMQEVCEVSTGYCRALYKAGWRKID